MQYQVPIPPLKIAVLGGGISGLATAFWLTRLIPGASISLFEKQDRLGGLIGTKSVRGRLLETGPLAFPSAAPATAEMMAGCRLGNLCQPVRQDGGIGLWVGGKIVPFSRTPTSILKSGLLSPMTLLRLLFEPFIPKGKGTDESVAEFFRRRTGGGFMEAIMEPMSSGILAGDPERMSMSANFPMLFGMERKWGSLARGLWKKGRAAKRKAGSKGTDAPPMIAGAAGNQTIVDAIAEELRSKGVTINLLATVIGIRKSAMGRTELLCGSGTGTGPVPYDAVIACIPPFELAPLIGRADTEIMRFLEGIPYSSIDLAYMSYRKPDFAGGFGGFGCLVRKRTGVGILSLFMPSRMFHGRCPDDEELVRIMAGGDRPRAPRTMDDKDVRLLSANAVGKILGPHGFPIDWTIFRHKDALPQLVTGHAERLAKAMVRLESEIPGLILAGTAFAGAGIENAVKEGKRAALEVLRRNP